MVEEVSGDLPGLERVDLPGLGRLGRAVRGRRHADRRRRGTSWPSGRPCWPSTTRSTSSTPAAPRASPRARRCPTTTSSTTGYFIGEGCRLHRGGPGLHPGAVLPLLRHGAGQPGLHHARRRPSSSPPPGFDPAADAAGGGRGALHVAVRRADHVHRRTRPARLRELRPVHAADRHHGRLAVPGRGDEAGGQRDAHGRGDHLLRDDRDLPGVHADHGRRRHGTPGVHGGPGAPARRGEDRRPGDRPDRAARASPGRCAPGATR